jgi:hypothetical protein
MPETEKKTGLHCVIWSGPVSASNLAGARLPLPSKIVTVNQGAAGGIGSSSFSALGRNAGSVRELLAKRGVDLDDCASLTLAGFSAAHGLIEVLLRDPETLERVSALVATDAYYTGGAGRVKEGFAAFAAKAAAGKRLAVFSSSPIAGAGYPSCTDSLGPLMDRFDLAPVRVKLDPQPARAFRRRGLWWLQYDQGPPDGHVMHAKQVAPEILSEIVAPYLSAWAATSSRSDALALVAALILIAVS